MKHKELLRDISELFPDIKCFPTVEQIAKTPDNYELDFKTVTNNPKPFAYKLMGHREVTQLAIDYWKDQIVFDLGSGRRTEIYGLACIAGARAYVPVEKYHMPRWMQKFSNGDNWEPLLLQYEKDFGKVSRPSVFPVYGDMLDFLMRLPNNSGSFLVSGIDRMIITEKETIPEDIKYSGKSESNSFLKAIETEIERTTAPNSACFALFSFLDLPNMKRMFKPEANFQVFTK